MLIIASAFLVITSFFYFFLVDQSTEILIWVVRYLHDLPLIVVLLSATTPAIQFCFGSFLSIVLSVLFFHSLLLLFSSSPSFLCLLFFCSFLCNPMFSLFVAIFYEYFFFLLEVYHQLFSYVKYGLITLLAFLLMHRIFLLFIMIVILVIIVKHEIVDWKSIFIITHTKHESQFIVSLWFISFRHIFQKRIMNIRCLKFFEFVNHFRDYIVLMLARQVSVFFIFKEDVYFEFEWCAFLLNNCAIKMRVVYIKLAEVWVRVKLVLFALTLDKRLPVFSVVTITSVPILMPVAAAATLSSEIISRTVFSFFTVLIASREFLDCTLRALALILMPNWIHHFTEWFLWSRNFVACLCETKLTKLFVLTLSTDFFICFSSFCATPSPKPSSASSESKSSSSAHPVVYFLVSSIIM